MGSNPCELELMFVVKKEGKKIVIESYIEGIVHTHSVVDDRQIERNNLINPFS